MKIFIKSSVMLIMGLLFILIMGSATTPTYAQTACPPPVNLQVGYVGVVVPGLPNAVRNLPGTSAPSVVVGQLEGGSYFHVLGGPTCVDGYNWWEVEGNGVIGWTADGTFGEHWVTPETCGNGMYTGLRPNITGRVTPGLPNVIRATPNGGGQVGSIPAGGQFTILNSAPACDNVGRMWWYVNYNGIIGWTAEGENGTYWLEPVTGFSIPTPIPPSTGCALPPRLQVGATGMVIPGDPNVLRTSAGTGTTVIGQLTQGAIFTVLAGPVCANGYQWWQVTAGGQTGWTAEGQGTSEYWLDPLVCANGMISRLAPGMLGRVAPGLPQRIRSAPNTASSIFGSVPAGNTMLILNNFQCDAQGRMWWQIYYLGRIGWTAEGENGVYWVNPA